jgi:7-keto-8-aminopelargonate synthetase-like enzyme
MIFHSSQALHREAVTDSGNMLFFSGTAYLGLNTHSEVQEYLIAGIRKYGTHYGNSRTSNIRLTVFEEFEAYLAQYLGVEAVLCSSSGYLAGQTAVNTLFTQYPAARLFYAPFTHPAVQMRQANISNTSYEGWATEVIESVNQTDCAKPNIIITDSINILEARQHSFEWLTQLKPQSETVVLIDDSHGLGVIGAKGKGIRGFLPSNPNLEYVIVGSLGKAYSMPTGIICASQKRIRQLTESPYFRGASPPSPAYLWVFMQSEAIRSRQFERLQANVQYFKAKTADKSIFSSADNLPIFRIFCTDLYEYLLHQNILISHFAYPKSDGKLISRVVLNANHTSEDLNDLVEAVEQYKTRF